MVMLMLACARKTEIKGILAALLKMFLISLFAEL